MEVVVVDVEEVVEEGVPGVVVVDVDVMIVGEFAVVVEPALFVVVDVVDAAG